MPRVYALLTPEVLKWAREKAGYDIETAAGIIGRDPNELIKWENGEARPTIPQARVISKKYKRPLAVFYLPEPPPKDFDILKDFRRLPDSVSSAYSPELSFLIRDLLFQQEWVVEFKIAIEEDEELDFIGSANTDMPSSELARQIRKRLNISPQEQIRCRSQNEALRLWIDRVERAGIFVCRRRDVESEEARGVLLSNPIAPFIFINSNDSETAQLFTLAHELAHLWIDEPGLSNLRGIEERPADFPVEVYCNKVAGKLLVDTDAFQKQMLTYERYLSSVSDLIKGVAASFKVSREVIARRLLDNDRISLDDYRKLRRKYQKEYMQQRGARTTGRGNYYWSNIVQNGYAFTKTVLSAYFGKVLSGRDASDLLKVKVNNLRKLAEHAR